MYYCICGLPEADKGLCILSRGIYSWHFALGTYNDLIHVPIIILRD